MDYLTEIDARRPGDYPDQSHRAVDLSHARWATVDAVTSIDLCAAALGRMHCGYPDKNGWEMAFGRAQGNATLLARPDCRQWIQAVQNDAQYDQVADLRHALVHRTARRRIDVALRPLGPITAVRGQPRIVGGIPRSSRVRLHVSNPAEEIAVEQLVPQCRDLARRHVDAFLSAVDRL
jgi:hypothetical protein